MALIIELKSSYENFQLLDGMLCVCVIQKVSVARNKVVIKLVGQRIEEIWEGKLEACLIA